MPERKRLTEEEAEVVALSRTQRLCNAALHSALGKLGALVPFLKDPPFAEEKEWRYIYMGPPEQASTRQSNYGPAEYNVISLKKGPRMDLNEIIVGPRAGAAQKTSRGLDQLRMEYVPHFTPQFLLKDASFRRCGKLRTPPMSSRRGRYTPDENSPTDPDVEATQ